MANWNSFVLTVPGKDLLEPVRNVLETLLVFLDVLKAILDTIKTFLIDFGNPIRALVEALIKIIEELFLALKTTGVSALYHIPIPTVDPNFQLVTGNDAFVETFRRSLYDVKDPNRPQPRPGSSKGGYVLLLVQANDPFTLLARIKQLLRFFSRAFTMPRFETPRNFKVTPVGDDGDPILAVADIFGKGPIESVQLSWTLPTSSETPDLGFSDVVNRAAVEFVPPKWLIEKSTINPANELNDIADIKNPSVAGKIEFEREVTVAGTPSTAKKRELLRDENGELVVKFTEYIILDQTSLASLVGQLGTYRYIDRGVTANQTYYYRVRAFIGDLKLTSNNQIDWGDPVAEDLRAIPRVRWPSSGGPDADVVAGKPTGTLSVRVPTSIKDFDVIKNLKRVYQSAFSCDFHRPVSTTAEDRLPGEASLEDRAGVLGNREFFTLQALIQSSGDTTVEAVANLEASNGPLTLPWEEKVVRRHAARLADSAASSLLEAGSGPLEQFRSLMRSTRFLLGETTLEAAVFRATDRGDDTPTDDKAAVFVVSYNDEDYREALVEVVSYLGNFTSQGVPPDWLTVSPLRDIIPWAGQILYDLLDKIQSLLDAFSGVISEINNFIALLERKIEALERTLQFLISILNLIDSLQVGAFVLAVPEIDGGPQDWVNALTSAGGDVPPSGPGGYSAGVALAYVAPDVTAFKTAFSIIFGV